MCFYQSGLGRVCEFFTGSLCLGGGVDLTSLDELEGEGRFYVDGSIASVGSLGCVAGT